MDEQEIRSRLEVHRVELRARIARVDADLRREPAPLSADSADQAIERANDEVLEEIGHSARAELRDIEAALARLDQGRYGLCTSCGATIDDERLAAIPYVQLCRSCAAKESRHG